MDHECEVLVIGGGIAGTAAALAAAGRHRRTILVRAAPGVTALGTGGWLGPMPERLDAALTAAGQPYLPVDAGLPHLTGSVVGYDRAAPAQRAATLVEGALVCGIAGLPVFRAAALARLWADAVGVPLGSATLDPGARTPPGGWSPVSLAAALDREPELLTRALGAAVRETGATCAILPPVLGIERSAEVIAALAAAAGVPVGEALGVPPSVPGWRLGRAGEAALAVAGVTVIRGRAVGRELEGRRVVAVRVDPLDAGAASTRIAAASIVLATGKFAGGGLSTEGPIREPALSCPVRLEHLGERYDSPDPLALTRPDRLLAQPLLHAGVAVDADDRPIDGRGDVVYENVRVAGTVRAGHDAAATGLGDAAVEGWRCGERAAEEAR